MQIGNPFENAGVASIYQAFRPRYHHMPAALIRGFVGKDFNCSLDVACGTGHSTLALSKISKRVVGCDQSEAMLAEARLNSVANIEFTWGEGERLPFAEGAFDFVNISMGFHWMNQKQFLSEAKRVLLPEGFLAIDNYGFSGRISDDAEKQNAYRDLFRRVLPPAGRGPGYPSDELISLVGGFNLAKEFHYEHATILNADAFSNLVMTWSNFQVLNDSQKPAAEAELRSVFDKIFEGQSLPLHFSGKAMLYGR